MTMVKRDCKPPSEGSHWETQAHFIAVELQQSGDIDSFKSQMGGRFWIKAPAYPYPIFPDFLLTKIKHCKIGLVQEVPIELIWEIQGELHFKTWKGRPAKRVPQKDEAKMYAVEAAGYKYLATPYWELPRKSLKTGSLIREKREAVKKKVLEAFK